MSLDQRRIAPHPGIGADKKTWQGFLARRPWDYPITAAIVHRDSPDALEAVLHLLRNQTVAPYCVVIDTGSRADVIDRLEMIERAHEDVEFHLMRSRGWIGTSQPVATAMDWAFSLCQTPYLYSTHTDVFLTRPDYLEFLVSRCDDRTPVVGYQMSPRERWTSDDWERTPSHTATLYHMPYMRANRVTWNWMNAVRHYQTNQRDMQWSCFPDTESGPAVAFEELGLGVRWITDPDPAPADPPSILLLGTEPNEPYSRFPLTHVRSAYSFGLYAPGSGEAATRADRMAREIDAAWYRPTLWRAYPAAESLGAIVKSVQPCRYRDPDLYCLQYDRAIAIDPDCLDCPLVRRQRLASLAPPSPAPESAP